MTHTETQFERHIDDFAIHAKKHENGLSVAFEVFEIVNRHGDIPLYGESQSTEPSEPYLTGSVKWDGCSNWHVTPDKYGYLHYCGKGQAAITLSKLFEKLYEIALELMPEHKKYLT